MAEDLEKQIKTFLTSPKQEELKPTLIEQHYARIIMDMRDNIPPIERGYDNSY